jgi:hypothetical protein
VKIGMFWIAVLCVAGLVGCSADPYKGPTPAPPDRLSGPHGPAPALSSSQAPIWGATGSVPSGHGSEKLAPNYSGYFPRVTGQ